MLHKFLGEHFHIHWVKNFTPNIVTRNDARKRSFFGVIVLFFLNKLLVFEHLHQDSNGGRVEGEIAFTTFKMYSEEGVLHCLI